MTISMQKIIKIIWDAKSQNYQPIYRLIDETIYRFCRLIDFTGYIEKNRVIRFPRYDLPLNENWVD